ncbi:hypothetical protein HUS23_03885 [Ectothiorhodospiraceae bacterium 2226]|nr:hypothetical protein HUS23_03885 [Ectothiorhodospiraceae bacterium 2226]
MTNTKPSLFLLHCIFLLLIPYSSGSAQTTETFTTIQSGGIITGGTIIHDRRGLSGPPPVDFSYLQQNRNDLKGDARGEYLSRWARFIEETVDCGPENKLGWFIGLAMFPADEQIKSESAAIIEKLVLENPRCALRGIRDMRFMPTYDWVIDLYLLNPTYHDVEELDAALRTALDEPEFSELAPFYRRAFEARQRAIAEAEVRRQQIAAAQRRQYWLALQDRAFYEESESEYWHRWHELVDKLDCDDPEQVKYLFDAAAKNVDIDAVRRESARLIEAMTLSDPACVLDGIGRVWDRQGFIETYLIASERVEDLHSRLVGVPGEGSRGRLEYDRAYARYRYRIADPVTDKNEFLWSVKELHGDREGRVFVPATYIKGHSEFQEALDRLWAETPDGDLRDDHGTPIKILPRDALDFMTLGQTGSYYLLNFTPEGLGVVKARAVSPALARWACGEVASLLVLEPESTPDWLIQTGRYPIVSVALELRDDLPEPHLAKDSWPDERLFYRGTLSWPDSRRSFDISFTAAYVGIEFEVVDNEADKKHFARMISDDSCH